MRTTLDVDEDVLRAAKEIARRRRVSVGKVLSDLARRALVAPGGTTQDTRDGVPLFPVRPDAGIVTTELVRQLLDEPSVSGGETALWIIPG